MNSIFIIIRLSKLPLRKLTLGLSRDQLEEIMEHIPKTLEYFALLCNDTKIREVELLKPLS